MTKLVFTLLLLLPVGAIRAQTNALSAVAVLTIHVSDTNTHERVFRLLTEVLKLPVDYGPEMHGGRRYAAVYAGNLFIEPCGPFAGTPSPTRDFQALFYGLNCVSTQSSPSLAACLGRLKLAYEQASPTLFKIQDASLAEGAYLGIDTRVPDKSAREREDRLGASLAANQKDGPGFECVREIWVGYTAPGELHAWEKFLGTAGKVGDALWRLDRNQSLRLVKADVRGVRGIVCQVQSMEKAQKYLHRENCAGRVLQGKIELEPTKTCGLQIWLEER